MHNSPAHIARASRGCVYTPRAVAALLGTSTAKLAEWRTASGHRGPPWAVRSSGAVVYPRADFASWCRAVPLVDGVPNIGANIAR